MFSYSHLTTPIGPLHDLVTWYKRVNLWKLYKLLWTNNNNGWGFCDIQNKLSRLRKIQICWWASHAVGLPKQCNLYQSTWTCLCFGSSTEHLAHQHLWFCTMWPNRAQGLLTNESGYRISVSFLQFIMRYIYIACLQIMQWQWKMGKYIMHLQ